VVAQGEAELKAEVEQMLKDYAGYGVRRVTKALQKAGYSLNHKRVRRLLRKWGLGWQPVRKKKPVTTQPDPNAVGADNLLAPAKQQGLIAAPNLAKRLIPQTSPTPLPKTKKSLSIPQSTTISQKLLKPTQTLTLPDT
jgi:hypothetical protein